MATVFVCWEFSDVLALNCVICTALVIGAEDDGCRNIEIENALVSGRQE